MNPSIQRLHKLELCLIPDTAVAYLTAQSHEERHKQFLSLTSYFREYASLQSQQTKPNGTDVSYLNSSLQGTTSTELDKTADTYSPPFRGQDKQDRSRSNKPNRNDALDQSPVLSLDKIRNYQDGVVA